MLCGNSSAWYWQIVAIAQTVAKLKTMKIHLIRSTFHKTMTFIICVFSLYFFAATVLQKLFQCFTC